MKIKKIVSSLTSAVMLFTVPCSAFGAGAAEAEGESGIDQSSLMTYNTVDKDGDGVYDYVEITGLNENVEDLTIPETIEAIPVTAIAGEAFMGHDELKTIEFPAGLATVGADAFSGTAWLEEQRNMEADPPLVIINNSIVVDGSVCTGNITLPKTIKAIADKAFYQNVDLTGVTFQANLKTIGESAFEDCSDLKTVTLPSSLKLTGVGKNAFEGTPWLDSKKTPGAMVTVGPVLIDGKETEGTIKLPSNVTIIADGAFKDNTMLENIATWPSKLETICPEAFMGCTSLVSAALPDALTEMGASAFEGCSSLEEVSFTEKSKLSTLESSVFKDCSSLQKMTFPLKLFTIKNETFKDCIELEKLAIPPSVTRIGYDAFEGTPWLDSRREADPLVTVNSMLIDSKLAEGDIIIPETINTIGDRALGDNIHIDAVTIKNPNCLIYDSSATISNDIDGDGEGYFNGTIYGEEESTAQAYANKYGYTFVVTEKKPRVTTIKIDEPEIITTSGSPESDKVTTSDSTTAPAASTTTSVKSGTHEIPEGFDGRMSIAAAQNVEGNAGETVSVPVYMEIDADTDPQTIAAVAFRVAYDEQALELAGIEEPEEGGLSGGMFMTDDEMKDVFFYSMYLDPVTVDPQKPACVLTFNIKDDAAAGTYDIEIRNHISDDEAVQIIHVQEDDMDVSYLEPDITNGSIVVPGEIVSTSSTTTTIASTTSTTTTTTTTSSAPVTTTSQPTTTTAPDSEPGFDGTVRISAPTGVEGEIGDLVEVPVYMMLDEDVDPQAINGAAFALSYDDTALTLYDVEQASDDFEGIITCDDNVVFITALDEYFSVDGNTPVCILRFEILDEASGEYPLEFVPHDPEFDVIEIIHTDDADGYTYLYPVTENGSIIVSAPIESTTSTQAVTTTKATTTTKANTTTVTTTTKAVTSKVTTTAVTTTLKETDAPVVSTTPVVTTTAKNTDGKDPVITTVSSIEYDGEVHIIVETGVTGHSGGYVDVPVYMEFDESLPDKSISAAGFKAVYDEEHLKLTNIIYNEDSGIKGGMFDCSVENGIFIYYPIVKDKKMTVDESQPIAVLRFMASEDALGTYEIGITNILTDSDDPVIIHEINEQEGSAYLMPVVEPGSAVIVESASSETPAEPEITTTVSDNYDGTAHISIAVSVKAEKESEVEVPVYMDIDGEESSSFAAMGFKVRYDETAMELTDIIPAEPSGLSGCEFVKSLSKGLFIYPSDMESGISLDSSKPICVLKFNVSSQAAGELPVSLMSYLGVEEDPIRIIRRYDENDTAMYLRPVVSDGSVIVDEPDSRYDGRIYINVSDNASCVQGQYVDVPVFMSLNKNVDPQSIKAAGFKAEYDTGHMTLTDIICGDGVSDCIFERSASNGIFLFYAKGKDGHISIDPNQPAAILRFKTSDRALGDYSVKLSSVLADEQAPIVVHDLDENGKAGYLEPVVKDGLITITRTGDTSYPDTQPDPAADTYHGKAYFDLEQGVTADADEEFYVPVHMSLDEKCDPGSIMGMDFKVKYDETAMELVNAYIPESSGLGNADMIEFISKGVFITPKDSEYPISVDPDKPAFILEFRAKEDVQGIYPITLVNYLDGESDKFNIIHEFEEDGKACYLEPVVNEGYVNIGNAETTWEHYDGDAYIEVAETVPAHAGGIVDVPVYMLLPDEVIPKYISAVQLGVNYDHEAMELVDILQPEAAGISGGMFDYSIKNNTFAYYSLGKNRRLAVIPERAVAILRFKVNENALGYYDVSLESRMMVEDHPVILHDVTDEGVRTYLRPYIFDGSVIVDDELPDIVEPVVTEPKFIGDAFVSMETQVRAMPGDTVDVPVYVELDGNEEYSDITAMGFNIVYDENALEYEDILLTDPTQIDLDVLTQFSANGFLLFENDNLSHIDIDPEVPFFTLRFKVKEDADGLYDIRMTSFVKDSDRFVHVIHHFDDNGMPVYYRPVITNGSILVSEQELWLRGDANSDGRLDVRDAAYIARKLSLALGIELPAWSDFNMDGKVNVRDAAMIARFLASRYE